MPAAVRPVYAPEEVARAIVELARGLKREVIVGVHAKAMIAEHATAQRLFERMAPLYVEHELFASGIVAAGLALIARQRRT